MHKKYPVFAFLLFLPIAGGCRINFEANTKVASDGSVERRVRYTAFDEADHKEIEERYALPANGKWETVPKKEFDVYMQKEREFPVSIYSVVEKFKPGVRIASDHVRKASTQGTAAKNNIQLRIRDHFFWSEYEFEEGFQDITNTEKAAETVQGLCLSLIRQFASILSKQLPGVSPQTAATVLHELFNPWIQGFTQSLRQGKIEAFMDQANELNKMFEKDKLVQRLMEKLPKPANMNPADWQLKMHESYDEMRRLVEPAFQNHEYEEALFGAYGFQLFQNYGFKETLLLPGKVIRTNAVFRSGNRLAWEFEAIDFRFREYKLLASSRRIHLERIALMTAVLLLLALALAVLTKRRWKNKKGRNNVSADSQP